MQHDDHRQQTLLDQYWDARNTGIDIPADPDPSIRETVDRFHASDDCPEPDPAFVSRLGTELTASSAARVTESGPGSLAEEGEPYPLHPSGRGDRELAEKQKSTLRQLAEMAAAAIVLVLITGGLILAYQNLIGDDDGMVPGTGEDDDSLVPSLTAAEPIPYSGVILDGYSVASATIGRFGEQDYALILAAPGTQAGVEAAAVLRVVQLNASGQHDLVGSLELDVPWTSGTAVAMGDPALVNGVLYMPVPAEERPGIWAVDLSDPESPVEAAFVDVSRGLPVSMAGPDDDMLVAATFDGPAYFIDVSDASDPDIISAWEAELFGFTDPFTIPSIALSESHLYVAEFGQLSIFDFSEPAELRPVVIVDNVEFDPTGDATDGVGPLGPLPDHAWQGIAVRDGVASIAAGERGVVLYDVSDPAHPEEIGEIDRPDRTAGVGVVEDVLYAAGAWADEDDPRETPWTWSLDAIDLSHPNDPVFIDRLDDLARDFVDEEFLAMNTRSLAAGRDYVVTVGHSGLLVAHVDWVEPAEATPDITPTPTPEPEVTEPSEPIDGQYPALSPFGVIAQHGEILDGAELGAAEVLHHQGEDYAYLLTFPQTGNDGEASPTLLTLRLDPSGQPEAMSSLTLDAAWSGPMQFNMGRMAIVDDVLFAPVPADEGWGVWSVDVSDPENPAELAFLDIEDDRPLTLVADGDVAVATGMFGNIFFILDISDPAEPSMASQVEAADLNLYSSVEVPSLAMSDQTLAIAHPRGLTLIDLSDPANPVERGGHENPEWEGLEGAPGLGTDTQAEVGEGSVQLDRSVDPGAFHDLVLVGEYAYVAAGDQGVLVFDVSDADAPTEVYRIGLIDRTYRLARHGDVVFALGVSADEDDPQGLPWTWSVDALDLGNPAEPEIVDHVDDLSGDAEIGDFLMMGLRQATAGQQFFMAHGRPGMILTRIDWINQIGD